MSVLSHEQERWPRLRAGQRLAAKKAQLAFVGLALALFALLGPVLAPYGPQQVLAGQQLAPPSSAHPFGTDINQMDVLSRVLGAARLDIGIALLTGLVAFAIGYPLGIMLGYYRNRATAVALRLLDALQSFPVLIIALAIVALGGDSAIDLVYAGVFVATPVLIRVVRAAVVSLRSERFIEAAVAVGNSDRRLIVRHVAPHALPTAVVQTTTNVAQILVLVAGLSFIGVGVHAPRAEWGAMIELGARSIVTGQWWVTVFPGLAIALSVLLFNLAGNLLRDLLAVDGG